MVNIQIALYRTNLDLDSGLLVIPILQPAVGNLSR